MTRRRKVHLLLWGDFRLLLFEGALRKWVWPVFSGPLLVVRDTQAMAEKRSLMESDRDVLKDMHVAARAEAL